MSFSLSNQLNDIEGQLSTIHKRPRKFPHASTGRRSPVFSILASDERAIGLPNSALGNHKMMTLSSSHQIMSSEQHPNLPKVRIKPHLDQYDLQGSLPAYLSNHRNEKLQTMNPSSPFDSGIQSQLAHLTNNKNQINPARSLPKSQDVRHPKGHLISNHRTGRNMLQQQ